MLAFTKTIARGNSDPMTKEQAAKIYIPIDGFMRNLKQGKAKLHESLEIYQHFLLISGAYDIALHKTKEQSKHLLKNRDKLILAALRIAKTAYAALKNNSSVKLTGNDINALDAGFTASIELLEALPDWCFMESGYQLMKIGRGKK